MNQEIYLIGLNHKTAPVDIRERFALTEADPSKLLGKTLSEALILSTCNRVEILAVGDPKTNIPERMLQFWAAERGESRDDLAAHTYSYASRDAVRHLFSVASSLDSMVLGEAQILGQLKNAYRRAVQDGAAHIIINHLLHKAFSTAKRVRTETAVASSAVSIASAAVGLARKIFTELSKQRALLIGAGEMAELSATHLLSAGVRDLTVINRTRERAEELAKKFHAGTLPWEELMSALVETDIVISSTGAPAAVIQAADMKLVLRKRRNRPIFFIDIAVPRDVDPDVNSLDNVYLYDIDDLKQVVEENMAGRREEAERAENIIEEEVTAFLRWWESLTLQPTIVALLEQGENIARKELRRSIKQLGPHPDPATVAVLERLSISLMHKLYHEPIVYLKRRAREEDSQKFLHPVRRLFNLDGENVPDDAHMDRKEK